MEHQEYYTVPLTQENIGNINILFKSVNNTPFDTNELFNKYNTYYTKETFLGYFAHHKTTDEVAAFLGIFPIELHRGNQVILAMQAGDVVTHYKHQKKGLFVFLAQNIFELCKQKGAELIFGFPNKNASHGWYNKLGWNIDHYMIKSTVCFNHIPFYKIINKLKLNELFFKYLKSNSNKINYLNNFSVENESNYFSAIRSDVYLRYKEGPNKFLFQSKGYSILYKIEYEIFIGDISWEGMFEKIDFLDALKSLSKKTGINKINFLTSEHSKFSKFLQENFPFTQSYSCGKLNLNEKKIDSLNFTYLDFDTY